MNTTPFSNGIRGKHNGAREHIENMFFTEGYTAPQIATELIMPLATIYVHIHAIRKKLRKLAADA